MAKSQPPPLQENLSEASSRKVNFGGHVYELYPKANYTIRGLVVSQHRSDSLGDLAHSRTGDLLNSRDLCIIWGSVLESGLYKKLEFSSGDWTCYVQATDADSYNKFRGDELSNNHLLAETRTVRKILDSIENGDEIEIQGQLVDYSFDQIPFRKTSLIRTDTGNGACETLAVQSVDIIKSHNQVFIWLERIGKLALAISLIAIVIKMFLAIGFR